MSMRIFKLFSLLLVFLLIFPNGIQSQVGSTSARSIDNENSESRNTTEIEMESRLEDEDFVNIDIRDHGPNPETTIILSGTTVVWTNKGTRSHTVIEGDPIYPVYLPLALRGLINSTIEYNNGNGILSSDTSVFDSGILLPGERYTFLFKTTGTYSYYSAYSPNTVVGEIIVVEANEIVKENVQATTGISLTTQSGVGVEIKPSALFTDTILTISTVLVSQINGGLNPVNGKIYNIELSQPKAITDTIKLSFPYAPGELEEGIAESDLRAFYHNGLDFIRVASDVDINQKEVIVETDHLSWWEIGTLCKPFGGDVFTEEEEEAYEKSRDYFNALSSHRDLFDKIITSDGEKVLDVRAEEAKWLADQRMCDLDDYTNSDILRELEIVGSPEDVARAMIEFGQGLQAQEYNSQQIQRMYDRLSDWPETAILGLSLVKLAKNGLVVGGLPFIADLVIHLSVHAIFEIYFTIMHVTEIYQDANYLSNWLSYAEAQGESNLTSVSGNDVTGQYPGGYLNPCDYNYGSTNNFYFTSQIYGEYSYVNLYNRGDTYFVVGLQDLGGFYEHPFNATDHLLMLLEYESVGDNGYIEKRIERLMFGNDDIAAICPTGKVKLTDIREGSPIKTTYYFIEKNNLSESFSPKLWSEDTWLCYGQCSEPTQPVVTPTQPPEPTGTPSPTGSWQEVGTGSASGEGISSTDGGSEHPELAIAPDGKPYVTWQERNSTETVFSIYTKRWNGSTWEEVGTGSASGTGISIGLESNWVPDIAISSTGVPYIAWHSTDSGNVEIYIRKWDGSSWVEVGAGSASGGGISNNSSDSVFASVAIAPDGTPYVAYHDSGDGDSEIYVKRWNGNSWAEVGVGSASGGGISKNEGASRYPALAISSGGTPFITWQDESSGDTEIYVRQWNGSSWVEVGAGSAVGGGISNNIDYSGKPSIATAQDGNPYITWDDSSNGVSQIYVRRWNGSSWVEVGTNSAIGDGISNNSDYSYSPTIAIGPDNIPYIAWYDFSGGNDTEIYVRRWNGISWVETNTGSASGEGISDDEQTSRSPTIAIAPDNTPYIAWYDGFEEVAEILIKRWVE